MNWPWQGVDTSESVVSKGLREPATMTGICGRGGEPAWTPGNHSAGGRQRGRAGPTMARHPSRPGGRTGGTSTPRHAPLAPPSATSVGRCASLPMGPSPVPVALSPPPSRPGASSSPTRNPARARRPAVARARRAPPPCGVPSATVAGAGGKADASGKTFRAQVRPPVRAAAPQHRGRGGFNGERFPRPRKFEV